MKNSELKAAHQTEEQKLRDREKNKQIQTHTHTRAKRTHTFSGWLSLVDCMEWARMVCSSICHLFVSYFKFLSVFFSPLFIVCGMFAHWSIVTFVNLQFAHWIHIRTHARARTHTWNFDIHSDGGTYTRKMEMERVRTKCEGDNSGSGGGSTDDDSVQESRELYDIDR